MKIVKLFPVLMLLALALIYCKPQPKEDAEATPELQANEFVPAPFPKLDIPGFNFPEDSTTINNWIANNDMNNIHLHGWGIWAGLTSMSNDSIGDQVLRVFETWATPSDIINATNEKEKNELFALENVQRGRAKLEMPNQFEHAAMLKGGTEQPDTQIAVSVAYSPAAAGFALTNKIFRYTTLAGYMQEGKTEIPGFPNDAITIKPTFKVITQSALQSNNGLYAMAAWPGPNAQSQGFPEEDWNTCIYVDVKNQGQGNGSVDKNCQGPTPATTYNISDFVYFQLSQEDANYFNQEFGLDQAHQAQAGDYAILVAMHVATRETTRWTWQSFWWAPNPDNPPAPSSAAIAAMRPKALDAAASHYAMTVAYSMVNPVQPEYGGQSVGSVVYGFNPYLEAGFGNSVLLEKQ